MLDRRSLQSWALSIVAVVGALAIISAPKLVFGPGPHERSDPAFVLGMTACMVLAMAWAAGFSIASFRRADEFVQTRSRFAWYWGSVIGLVAMAPLFGFAMTGGLKWIAPGVEISRQAWLTYAYGLMTPLVAQVVGFVAVTVWWQATKR